MRLIDADALKEKIEQCGGEGTMARYCKRVLAECLDNDAPTADAIPVEWLDKKFLDIQNKDKALSAAAWLVLHAWQKEQEAR